MPQYPAARCWRLRAVLGVFALVLCIIVQSRPAAAWWNSDWAYRVKVDADTSAKGANVAAPIGHVQVLLRLHAGNFNFASAKDDGSDLRVVAGDDRTPLHFQIERYDGLVDQVGLIWVDVPALAAATVTSFYVYWGNKAAANGSDGHATFGADQLLVYHFAEENGLPRDATGFANDARSAGKRVDGGMIGNGLHVDGSAPIHLPQSPSLALTVGQPTTWSLWIHLDDATGSGVLYDDRDGANEFEIGIQNRVPYAQLVSAGERLRTAGGAAPLAAGWHLIDVTASDRLTIYADGQKIGDVAGTLPALNGEALLGGTSAGSSGTPEVGEAPAVPGGAVANLTGIIDEFRIDKGIAAQGQMQARVRSEGPSPGLLVLETPEQSSAFGSGYIGIILKSVTPDAWAVIGILAFMSAISWLVMITKAIYVSRGSRANIAFRRDYRTEAADAQGDLLGVMRRMQAANRSAWASSSLFRLNGVATVEIDDRLNGGRVDSHGMLASQSIAAIRSALDGRMALEIQRLNRMMVLLTIAIAGGPFIGLLGTVIGVMITFAAIAQAGDVNVNAIAPGISAALLATVAGLAVAIPALFGYNYFNTRITDAISDMQVHIDMLVTRMGEGLLGRQPQAGE